MIRQGRAALNRMAPQERATSDLITFVARLLHNKGELVEAEMLYREVIEATREALGDKHLETLVAINNLGTLLAEKGDLDSAEVLHRDALEGARETLGDQDPHTLCSIHNLGMLLADKGDLCRSTIP